MLLMEYDPASTTGCCAADAKQEVRYSEMVFWTGDSVHTDYGDIICLTVFAHPREELVASLSFALRIDSL